MLKFRLTSVDEFFDKDPEECPNRDKIAKNFCPSSSRTCGRDGGNCDNKWSISFPLLLN